MPQDENYQHHESMVKPTKKSSSFMFYSLMSLLLVGLFGAAYYIVFQPDLSFIGLGDKKEQTRVTARNTVNQNSANNVEQNINKNDGRVNLSPLNSNSAQSSAQNTLKPASNVQNGNAQSSKLPSMFEEANGPSTEEHQNLIEIPLQSNTNQQLSENNLSQGLSPLSPEENLPTSDMQSELVEPEPMESAVDQTQVEQTQVEQAQVEEMPEQDIPTIAEGDEFELAPPVQSAEIILPSEEELKELEKQQESTLLEQLQKAKNDNAKLAQATASLPDNKFSLSNETASGAQDLHITNIFITELANLAVEKYSPKNVEQKNPLTATEAARYFGTTMHGLEHPNGRLGIFTYAYNPQLIEVLAKNLAPKLINEMEVAAKQKTMSNEQIHFMFQHYASQARITATQLEAIINSKNIDVNLEEYLRVEEELRKYQEDFASAQLEFAERSRQRKNTKSLENEMKEMAKKASQAQQELVSIRNLVVANIAKNASATTPRNSLLDLALWIKRRNNEAATKSAIEALYYVANIMEKK